MEHHFLVEPFGRHGAWQMGIEGSPSLWWSARLSPQPSITLPGNIDAWSVEATVSVSVGDANAGGKYWCDETMPPRHVAGVMSLSNGNSISIQLKASEAAVRLLLLQLQSSLPPRIKCKFGPTEIGQQLATGVLASKEHSEGYSWSDQAKHPDGHPEHVIIEEAEFSDNFQTLLPWQLEDTFRPSATARNMNTTFSVIFVAIAVTAALVLLATPKSAVDRIVVGLLLLLGAGISFHHLRRQFLKLDSSSVSLALRRANSINRGFTESESKIASSLAQLRKDQEREFAILFIGTILVIILAACRTETFNWRENTCRTHKSCRSYSNLLGGRVAMPAQAGSRANIRLMFQLRVTKFHSPLTFSRPRNKV